jgi:hypothetical protein
MTQAEIKALIEQELPNLIVQDPLIRILSCGQYQSIMPENQKPRVDLIGF